MAKSLIDKVSDTIVELKDRVVGLEKKVQDYAFDTATSSKRKTKRAATRGKKAVKKVVRTTKTKTRAKVRKAAGRRR
jgi:sensor histidine kinase regulating citrate/malate metabolism